MYKVSQYTPTYYPVCTIRMKVVNQNYKDEDKIFKNL